MGKAKVPEATQEEYEEIEKDELDTIIQHKTKELVQETLLQAAKELYQAELRSREIPFAVNAAMRDLYSVVDLAFLRPDKGETREEIESAWMISTERAPPSSTLDSWARAAIPVKSRKFRPIETPNKVTAKLPSESGRSKAARSVSSKLRGVPAATRVAREAVKRGTVPEYIVKLTDDFGDPKSDASSQAHRRSSEVNDSLLQLRAQEELHKKREIIEEERRKRKQEELEEKARAEKLAKDLRGKDFSLDENGEIIMIQHVNGDKLPSKRYNLEHEVLETCEMLAHETDEVLVDGQDGKGQSTAKGGYQYPAFYRPAESFQQSVLKNPTLEVVSGVAIREGASSKAGPAFKSDSKHMTRENFAEHQSLLFSHTSSPEVSSTLAEESNLSGTGALGTIASPENSKPEKEHSKSASRKQSKSGTGTSHSLASSALEGSESVEPGTGAGKGSRKYSAANAAKSSARRASTASVTRQSSQVSVDGNFGAASFRGYEESLDEEVEDYNMTLIGTTTWGQNPAPAGFIPAVLPHNTQAATDPTSPKRPRRLVLDQSGRHAPSPPLLSPVESARSQSIIENTEYVRDFEKPATKGTIKVETDRAYRILGLADPKQAHLSAPSISAE